MIRAVLVDFDGTLVDTYAVNCAAYRQALDELGVGYDAEKLASLVGRLAWRPMLQQVLPGNPGFYQEIVERKRVIYQYMTSHVTVNDHLVEILLFLKPRVSLALVTSASKGSVEPLLHAKKLDAIFDFVVTSDDVEKQKPDPESYCRAAQWMGVDAADCLALEDSEVGLEAARRFGAQVWKVEWLTCAHNPAINDR